MSSLWWERSMALEPSCNRFRYRQGGPARSDYAISSEGCYLERGPNASGGQGVPEAIICCLCER